MDSQKLPISAFDKAFTRARDVSEAAVVLVQAEPMGRLKEESAGILRHMTDVFVAAQMRLRQIESWKHDPSGSSEAIRVQS